MFVKYRPTHGNGEWSRGEDVDGDSSHGCGLAEVVAAFCPSVASGNNVGDSLSRGLLGKKRRTLSVGTRGFRFTTTKALGHDHEKIIFDNVDLGEIDAVGGVG